MFPNHFGVKSKGPVDLTHLDRHPGLRDGFAFGYVMHCLGVEAADRRYTIDQTIKGGFLRYLDDRKIEGLQLSQITEQTLKDFKGWLDDEDSAGFLPSKISRKIKIQDLQLILKMLIVDPTWGPQLSPDLRLLEGLYPGAHQEIAANPDKARCHDVAGTSSWRNTTPNHLTRTPGLCAGCPNFSVSAEHAGFWRRRFIDNQTSWLRSDRSTQFRVVEKRAQQAELVLNALGVPRPVILVEAPSDRAKRRAGAA